VAPPVESNLTRREVAQVTGGAIRALKSKLAPCTPPRARERFALKRDDGSLFLRTRTTTVAYRKTAIAVPEALLADVDRAANARGESRSAYITRVLSVAVRARRDAAITRKLDELFADERLTRDQRRSTEELDLLGTAWTDERW
jgi:hypothetical protein